MAGVVLVGTLDTKGAEYEVMRDHLRALGHQVTVVDAGVLGAPGFVPDISRAEVAAAAGADIDALLAARDRGVALTRLSEGARVLLSDLHAQGRLHGVAAMGGSGGSALAATAMRGLPVGVPKLIVSTVASGDTRAYVGTTDITMMHSVVDVAGLNRISRRVIGNAAGAIAGMATAYQQAAGPTAGDRPLVGATMFGVTTPGAMAAKARLEEQGYEVIIFHAVGTGGQALEALVAGGYLAGVLDLTTTELADALVGGIFPAHDGRLTMAGKHGVPQVVSLGALDMVNFGPRASVPARFEGRLLYEHNANITLMRTTPEECAVLGRQIGERLAAADAPTRLFIPKAGISAIAVVGGVFHDPDADAALLNGIQEGAGGQVEITELDLDINDSAFAQAMADALVAMMRRPSARGVQK
ncbi:Tm-1-like ATP-binding domain-containing protein [Devosia nitrariae]|uniref:Uncharacterized protein n=1 Tax=Devosia nitrariae TaxID=2071872 RepID=A0ABQ5VZJ8_9HYPH|nr:Tm-1-like ATP-binding domain-containing protein [Devosia nitrariae]GLQ53142.1 hypothetical protein GCM10010862_04000 [Devosia nitrariae]